MKPCKHTNCSNLRHANNVRCPFHLSVFNKNRRKPAGPRSKDIRQKDCERKAVWRATKKASLQSIEDQSLQRIATELTVLKTPRKDPLMYIIVRDVINGVSVNSLKLEKKEPITFGTEISLRTMYDIVGTPKKLACVLDALTFVFPGCKYVKTKVIKSKAGDLAQLTHTDYNSELINNRIKSLADFHYSAIIALQPDTHLLIGRDRVRVEIPVNAMLLFRGDCPHAGGAYPVANSRIFLSLSSDFHPLDNKVYLVN